MFSPEKPKSRLLAHAPQCPRCRTMMKVRTLRPGQKVDDVVYRCEQCRDEIVVEVKRV
jgi:predicted SprT family Zn-dependent metalloprotease